MHRQIISGRNHTSERLNGGEEWCILSILAAPGLVGSENQKLNNLHMQSYGELLMARRHDAGCPITQTIWK